jgi:alpha 1,6-mannosyltransferase
MLANSRILTNLRTFVALGILSLIFLLFRSNFRHLRELATGSRNSIQPGFPRKVWQTYNAPPHSLGPQLAAYYKSWVDMNPGYRFELLTDESSLTYIRDRFSGRASIIELFEQMADFILRADLLRYLTLLVDGGVYTDIDTDCSKPISEWIPPELVDGTGLVMGVEYDAQGEEIRGDSTLPVQLCQWTIMAKPNHPVMQQVVQTVVGKLEKDMRTDGGIPNGSFDYVLETTGPRVGEKVPHR